jgi:hypothetical protein
MNASIQNYDLSIPTSNINKSSQNILAAAATSFLFLSCFQVLQSKNVHELLAHKIGLLGRTVVALNIFNCGSTQLNAH